MTTKVDEILATIPTLKINLNDIIDFKDKCVDQLAIDIITESIDYALETSIRRLESVAKINPSIRDNATQTILPAIKTLRNLIENAPACTSSALSGAPIKTVPTKPKTGITRTKETKGKDHVTNITKAVSTAKTKLPTKVIPIDFGRVFEIEYDGAQKKYLLVARQAMKNPLQVPSEENTEKLSEDSPLAKILMGKKTGETAEIKIDNKTYTATIKDVREGSPMILLPGGEKGEEG